MPPHLASTHRSPGLVCVYPPRAGRSAAKSTMCDRRHRKSAHPGGKLGVQKPEESAMSLRPLFHLLAVIGLVGMLGMLAGLAGGGAHSLSGPRTPSFASAPRS